MRTPEAKTRTEAVVALARVAHVALLELAHALDAANDEERSDAVNELAGGVEMTGKLYAGGAK